MLYIQVIRNEAGKVTTALLPANVPEDRHHLETRNDWKSMEAAEEVAAALGPDFIATDAGPHVSPRYDVIKLPKVGDEVSYAFNGDSYPDGKIVSVSPSLKMIKTSSGRKYYRVRQTGSWRNSGTWFLTPGHVYKQNPSF